jgi:type I restriction enzyme S subunit
MNEQLENLFDFIAAGEWGSNQGTPGGLDTGVIRSANFTKNHQFNTKEIVVRSIEERKRQRKLLCHGDILIEKSGGSPDQPVGRVLFYDLEGEHTCSNFISILRPSDQADPKFLYYSLCNLYERGVVKNYQQQTTGIINLQLGEYLRESIFLPPLPEQKKIAEILSGIDLQLASDIRKLDKLTKLLQALAEEEVCKSFREIPALPLSSLFADKPSNGISPPETEDGDIIAAPGIDCISQYGFDAKRLKKVQRPPDWKRYLIKDGDFFITRANTPSLVGMCAVAKKVTEEMIYPDLMVRLRFANKDHGPYLETIFRTSTYRRIVQNSAQGTSQSMAKLNGQIISNIKVAMPGDDKVRCFNKNIERVLEAIELEKSRIECLQKMKKALSADLLSGRKRVSI